MSCIKRWKQVLPNSVITGCAIRFHEIQLVFLCLHCVYEVCDDFLFVDGNRLEHALYHFRQLGLVHSRPSLQIEKLLETSQRISWQLVETHLRIPRWVAWLRTFFDGISLLFLCVGTTRRDQLLTMVKANIRMNSLWILHDLQTFLLNILLYTFAQRMRNSWSNASLSVFDQAARGASWNGHRSIASRRCGWRRMQLLSRWTCDHTVRLPKSVHVNCTEMRS